MEIQIVEWVWTVIPAFLLLQIALPSLLLLYIIDETSDSTFTVKTIGHQWYWSYEYSNYRWADSEVGNINIDSYIIPGDNEDNDWMFRLLDVDNHTILPVGLNIRVLITSADVLHSWTVPSLGVKADAVPGRLNQVKFTRYRTGLYFGQCSEICGANHRFMPIVVELIPESYFTKWCARWLAENE